MGLAPALVSGPDFRLLVFSKGVGGIGSSHFSALGQKFGGSIRELAASRGASLDDFSAVALVGFSAAHGLFESLLRGPDAGRVVVLHAADAYYTGPGLEVKRGYHALLERAGSGNALAILTTSNIAGPAYPSGAAAVEKLVADLDLDALELADDALLVPERVQGRAGIVWADYGGKFKHPEHATKLAPLWWANVERKYLERGQSADDGTSGFDFMCALAALGLVWMA